MWFGYSCVIQRATSPVRIVQVRWMRSAGAATEGWAAPLPPTSERSKSPQKAAERRCPRYPYSGRKRRLRLDPTWPLVGPGRRDHDGNEHEDN